MPTLTCFILNHTFAEFLSALIYFNMLYFKGALLLQHLACTRVVAIMRKAFFPVFIFTAVVFSRIIEDAPFVMAVHISSDYIAG